MAQLQEEFMLIDDDQDWVFTVRVPKQKKRVSNSRQKHDSVIGVVDAERGNIGFAMTIDMAYKGKPDQWTQNFIELSGFYDESEFAEICRSYNIPMAYVSTKRES